MVEKSFGLLFFLKKSQNRKDEKFIYLKITVDGQSKELSTKRKWEAANWNANIGRATGNKESVKTLNSYLHELEQQVYQAKKRLMENDKEITAQSIKDILTGNYDQRRTILELFK